MKSEKTEVKFNEVSKFIQFETERLYRRKKVQMKVGVSFLLAGLAFLIPGYKIQLDEIMKLPIPSVLKFAGIGMIFAGLFIIVKMVFIKKNKISRELEAQFAVSQLSAKDFDEEMEQYGGYSLDKPTLVTRHFIVQREPSRTKALYLNEVYFITGAFTDQNKECSETGYMLYDGKEDVDEHTKEEYSGIGDDYFIEFYDEDGEPIVDYENKRFTVKTGKEKITKEILHDIHSSHPWIYMGREQLDCMKDDNVLEYKLLFDENRRRYLETI